MSRVIRLPPKVDKEEWPLSVERSSNHWDVLLNLTHLECARQLLADVRSAEVKLWDGTPVKRKSDVLKWIFEQWDKASSESEVVVPKRHVQGKDTRK